MEWTTNGTKLAATGEAGTAGLLAMFARMEWHDVPCSMPAMQGLAVDAIRAKWPMRITRVSWSHELAPYGLIGIEYACKRDGVPGRGSMYALDMGDGMSVLAADWAVTA
jgi:hypothetical protein